MKFRNRSISIPVDTYVSVDVADIVSELDADEVRDIALARGVLPEGLGCGDGDASRLRGIVDAAERELRRMPHIPRELADLMWHVHGRAIA